MYVYIYIYTHLYVYIYIYTSIPIDGPQIPNCCKSLLEVRACCHVLPTLSRESSSGGIAALLRQPRLGPGRSKFHRRRDARGAKYVHTEIRHRFVSSTRLCLTLMNIYIYICIYILCIVTYMMRHMSKHILCYLVA